MLPILEKPKLTMVVQILNTMLTHSPKFDCKAVKTLSIGLLHTYTTKPVCISYYIVRVWDCH